MDETALGTHSDTRPWHLPSTGVALFEGDRDVGLLSQYFLPGLVLEGRSILFLDGGNSSNPRLMARLARRRGIPFQVFSRRVLIARAFTCFQMTELIARVPKFQSEYGVDALLVTALPELYFDEDIGDSDARRALEQALRGLARVTREGNGPLRPGFIRPEHDSPRPARGRIFLEWCARLPRSCGVSNLTEKESLNCRSRGLFSKGQHSSPPAGNHWMWIPNIRWDKTWAARSQLFANSLSKSSNAGSVSSAEPCAARSAFSSKRCSTACACTSRPVRISFPSMPWMASTSQSIWITKSVCVELKHG